MATDVKRMRFFDTAESDEFTPTANLVCYQLTGNSIVVPPGAWRIQGTLSFQHGSPGTVYNGVFGVFAPANGENTATAPPLVPVLSTRND